MAVAAPVRDGHVEAELLSEVATIAPGSTFWVGVRLRMDPEWHTYWLNPGDTGLGTTIQWNLPDGMEAGPIQWPCPEIIEAPPSFSYGYFDEVTLLVQMTASPDLKPDAARTIGVRVKWLACKDKCLGGAADLSLDFPATVTSFADVRARLPKDAGDWYLKATFANNKFELSVQKPASSVDSIRDLYFFASDPELLDHAAAQTRFEDGRGSRIVLARSPYESIPVERLQGLLRINNEPQNTLAVDLPVEK